MESVPGADRAMYVGIQGGRPNTEAGFTESGSAKLSGTILYARSRNRFVPAQYVNEAVENITRVIAAFRSAIGLCIVISSDSGFGIGSTVTGIHQSGREFEEVFKMFGYATYHVRNPNCNTLKGLYRSLATQITYPDSYRRFIFFYTGHGYSDHISLDDGDISIYDMISNFWKSKVPDIAHIPKIFIFDCCRTDHPDMGVRRSSTSFDSVASRNIYILYTTLPYSQSYASDGASIPTTSLVAILKDPSHDFLKLHISLYTRIRETCDNPSLLDDMNPVCQSAIYENINFHRERQHPMKPTSLRLQWDPENTAIQWEEPVHARVQELTGYEVCIQSNGDSIETIPVSKAQKTFSVSSHEVENCQVFVQAKYKDGTVVRSDQSAVQCCWTWKHMCTRCVNNCTSWCLASVTAVIAILSFILLGTTIVFIAVEDRKISVFSLIVSGDIISHSFLQPSWLTTIWYSRVSLRMIEFPPSDEPLNVSVIQPGDAEVTITQYDLQDYYPSSFYISPTNEMYMFPLNYNSMPLYFVQGSSITFQLFIQLPTIYNVVRSAAVYIFDFFENMPDQPTKSDLSKALDVFDITNAASKSITFSYNVKKNSYLFFYINVNTSANDCILYSNLTFLQRKFTFARNPTGDVFKNTIPHTKYTFVEFSMFSPPPPDGIYLYAHQVEDTDDVLLDHVEFHLEYRVWFQCLIGGTFLVAFLGSLLLFITCLLYKYKHRRHHYAQLQNFNDTAPCDT